MIQEVIFLKVDEPADFSYWEKTKQAEDFRQAFKPREIAMEYRLPNFENPARQFGVTLGQIAKRKTDVPELQQTTVVMRADAYRRNLYSELDRVKDLLLGKVSGSRSWRPAFRIRAGF